MTSAACLLAVIGLASPAAAAPRDNNKQISAEKNAAQQIAALQALKKSQSPAEAKVDTRLVVQQRVASGRLASSATPMLNAGVKTTAGGKVMVDIRATVNDGLLKDLAAKGASVKHVSTRYGQVRAEVPLSAVTAIAGRADVRQVEEAGGYLTARELNPVPAKPESKEEKAARIAENTRAALRNRAGAVESEGDRAHNSDNARQDPGVTGVGVKICALSDGVDSLETSQAAGELPAVDVLPGMAGGGDEGTAMLEIIHDVAPGAELGFATAFISEASFADNIRALRFDAGCDIVVDDILYFAEPAFQDGIVAQAVNDVVADGGLYFSSAGNEGNTADGTSGHWEGDFVNSGQVVGKFAGHAHDFDPGPGTQIFQPLSNESGGVPVLLNWADPMGGSTNDYDLYLLDSAGNVVSMSQNYQNGTQNPYERVNTPGVTTGMRLAVVKFTGADRYLSLSALRGRFEDQATLKAFTTPGVTVGHSAARGAFSTAAAPAKDPLPFDLEAGDPPNPTGPYPGAFDSSTRNERFSSDGPRRIFFEGDGTPITPGDFSGTGGEVRQKPDITAADGVSTSVQGFETFFGTSAAAPHAAAIAGLVLSGNPGIDPAEVREALVNTAIDIGAPGVDPVTGHGVILADRVLAYTGASPQPLAVVDAPKVAADDGGEYLDPGDTATVSLPVTNIGDGTAVSTSVVVTTSTPGVTVTPRAQSYGAIPKGETVVKEYQITVPASHEVGVPINFSTRVTFAGVLSPRTSTFTAEVGRPSPDSVAFSYTGDPIAIPDNSTVGATVSIPVSDFGRASRVTFSIDGTECNRTPTSTTVGINHSFVGDLVGQLTAPSGATALVFSRNGGTGENMCQVVFDDDATTPFSTVTSANAPFTGTWAPVNPISPLRGGPADGTWTFKVTDTAGADTGSLRSVSLHLNGYISE